MKKIIISCAFLSFVFLFLGTCFVLYGSVDSNPLVIYIGLGLYALAGLGYIFLGIQGILWVRKKGRK